MASTSCIVYAKIWFVIVKEVYVYFFTLLWSFWLVNFRGTTRYILFLISYQKGRINKICILKHGIRNIFLDLSCWTIGAKEQWKTAVAICRIPNGHRFKFKYGNFSNVEILRPVTSIFTAACFTRNCSERCFRRFQFQSHKSRIGHTLFS